MVLYGPPGVGKTSFAANFPHAGFIHDPQERGIHELVEFKQCPKPEFKEEADCFETLLDKIGELAVKPRCQTLVLDSMTGFEKLCFIYHCREYFDDDWTNKGFYSFQQGPKNAAKVDWPRLLDHLNLVIDAGINVIVCGHSQVKPFVNPNGPDYDRYVPYLDKETWAQTHRWAKAVIFYNYADTVEKEGAKHKGSNDNDMRFLHTKRDAAYDAKNIWGLSPVIEAGETGKDAYEAFKNEFVSCCK